MILKLFILIFGAFACSVSVIFIKASTEHSLLVAAYRLFVAAFVLTPFLLRDLKKLEKKFSLKMLRPSIVPGMTLGLHLITWVIGARMTLAAHSTLIVNMVPVIMPVFLFVFSREIINRREIAGTALAISGVIILGWTDFRFSREMLYGDFICFLSMILFAVYLALARKNKDHQGMFLYIVPLYFVAGLFSMAIALFFVNPVKSYTLENILHILGLGIIPTVIGHSILNYSMKHFRGQLVSIINLSQFIFAGIMGYFLLGEVLRLNFYVSGLLVAGGAFIVIWSLKPDK
ncbi:MAG TPA: DMT family transporter [Spirochaetes bacterium]|nr:DMT family transporter [Spirochaetota bacterium]